MLIMGNRETLSDFTRLSHIKFLRWIARHSKSLQAFNEAERHSPARCQTCDLMRSSFLVHDRVHDGLCSELNWSLILMKQPPSVCYKSKLIRAIQTHP